MTSKIDTDKRIKEAEIYSSQGLFEEALVLYEEILSEVPDLDPEIRERIDAAIDKLQGEIENLIQEDPHLSSQDISLIKESWAEDADVPDIIDSASAFVELGLYRDAVKEYLKLFDHPYPVEELAQKLAGCLFETHSPGRVIDQVDQIVAEKGLGAPEHAALKFCFGQEMENRGHKDLALEVYEAVKKLQPDYAEIDRKLTRLRGTKNYDSRYSHLLAEEFVTTAQLQNALSRSKKMKKSVEFILMEQFRVPKADIGKSLSLFYQCPFVEFDPKRSVPYELLAKLKKSFLLQNSWVPLGWDMGNRIVEILIDDPRDLSKTDPITLLFNVRNLKFFVGIREDINQTIELLFEEKGKSSKGGEMDEGDRFDMLDIDFEEEAEDDEDAAEYLDEASGQVVKTVDQILITAYRKNASDIHIEPSPVSKSTSIRYRIDGVCQEITQLPNTLCRGIMSRLKIMSGLDIAERRLPQDGKIKFKRKGIKAFELRLATLPTAGGFEDAVLRILAESGAMSLDDMGMNGRNLSILKKIIRQPHGLVLVVGPTGSGKTTTLHASLGHINQPSIKIWTAEDPVEITQPGLRQVECRPKIGLDFARVMRAFLRADPDVIMIGEMRDKETASIGIEASLTGHLVFSTLHTNSAPETVTRLLDMGLNALNFSDAFLGVLAQRLVRRLCTKCRKAYRPTRDEWEEIVKEYGQEAFEAHGLKSSREVPLHRTVGCESCSGTGYRGRLGVHELMAGSKEIKRMIKREATSEALFEQSVADGMTTIKQDGIQKVLQGLTDIREIQRVCVE